MIGRPTDFTKGPWHAGVQYDDEFGCPVMDASGREVAEAKGENEDECAANARLIAVAPQMFDILARAYSVARQEGRDELSRLINDVFAEIGQHRTTNHETSAPEHPPPEC